MKPFAVRPVNETNCQNLVLTSCVSCEFVHLQLICNKDLCPAFSANALNACVWLHQSACYEYAMFRCLRTTMPAAKEVSAGAAGASVLSQLDRISSLKEAQRSEGFSP